MAAILDRASFLPELKAYYHDERTKTLIYKNRPLLGMMPKRTDWDGYKWELPVQHGVVQGLSSTFATAQANKTASEHKRFSIPLSKYYALADVENSVIDTSKGDKGSFMRALTNEVDGAFLQFANESAHALYGDGSGRRAAITGATENTTSMTMAVESIINFEIGMQLVGSANADGSAAGATVVTVTAVNRTTGTITTSAGLTAGDLYVFREGDIGGKLLGLSAWLTDDAGVLAVSYLGVDRSVDPTRLAGIHYDGTAETIEDAVINAGAVAFREGATPSVVVMNPTKVAALDRLLESGSNHRSRFDKVKSSDAELGFDSIRFHTPAGVLDVVSDPYCPVNTAYMLDLSTWSIRSAGAWGKFLGRGSFDQGVLRNTNSDSIEFRIGGYGNMGCSAPGRNVVIDL